MDDLRTILVRCSARDRPGITTGLLGVLARSGAELYDMEQVVVRDRLTLDLLIGVGPGDDILKDLLFHGWEHGLQLEFEMVEALAPDVAPPRSVVTVIGQQLQPAALAAMTGAIAEAGGNIDRILRLSRYPVVSFEFVVTNGDFDRMRRLLLEEAAGHAVDVAVQSASLERRAKRLVMLDVDSTLIQDEVIDLLAEEAGCVEEVAELTRRAMDGELDFEEALRARVRLLAGTSEEAIDRVAARIRLTPGARTFVRTLKRLGYTVAIVSGGFDVFTDRLAEQLGIDHAIANRLAIADGRLTGELDGPVIDRRGKAEALRRIAAEERIPLSQTVAVGDGANDVDMLETAGLGVAFNARAAVRAQADTALSVPYLDAILFLFGIHRDEVEAADAADPQLHLDALLPVPGVPPV
jgi:phosphoserine phosphatase